MEKSEIKRRIDEEDFEGLVFFIFYSEFICLLSCSVSFRLVIKELQVLVNRNISGKTSLDLFELVGYTAGMCSQASASCI